MGFDIPLFAFGLFITLLVAIGVLLALAEFRAAHTSRDAADQSLSTSKGREGKRVIDAS